MQYMRQIALTTVCVLMSAVAHAQGAAAASHGFPHKPIRIIVSSGPGGGQDLTTRPIAQKLAERLAVSVVVDNRGGASGAIAMDLTHQAAPDGYTLLVGATTVILTGVTKKVSYDIRKVFDPVVHLTTQPYLLVFHPSVPVRTPKEFVALAKAKPGTLTYGTSGEGSLHNLGMDLFQSITGTSVIHVPYKGSGPALIDLLGGQINFMFTSTISAAAYIKSGRLKAIAATSRERIAAYADLPTLSETIAPGYDLRNNYYILAPVGVPTTVLKLLNTEISRITNSREVRDKLTTEGANPAPPTSIEQLRKEYSREVAKWEQVTKSGR